MSGKLVAPSNMVMPTVGIAMLPYVIKVAIVPTSAKATATGTLMRIRTISAKNMYSMTMVVTYPR